MSKIRYEILRISLRCFLVVMGIKAIKDLTLESASEWVALSLGILAAVVNHWPEKNNTINVDSA